MSESRDTVGKLSTDLLKSFYDNDHTAEDQMREQLMDYDRNIHECVDVHKKNFAGDFFVVVLTKKERLMQNVLRHYFLARLSCPTPEWDQTVYKYIRSADEIKFMWTIPSKDTCETMMKYPNLVDKEEQDLLNFVVNYYDGTLFKLAKRLNNEEAETPLLVT